LPDEGSKPQKRVEARTEGFDETQPTPRTPSTREGWDKTRHEDALEFHKRQNERAGMREEVARRNQYCPKCRGVVEWNLRACPHCGAEIPEQLRDYYNFSDFEPKVDRKELAPILTAFAVGLALLGLLVWGAIELVLWILR
jgi:preprotein translocase subunit Sss1